VPKLPNLTGAELVRALQRAGFKLQHVRGSHHIMRHPDGRGASIPVHGSQSLKPGLIVGVLHRANMTADDVRKLL
jgi:predicted RNA binding protein YcfA (HicA-like mRNA interferase family)